MVRYTPTFVINCSAFSNINFILVGVDPCFILFICYRTRFSIFNFQYSALCGEKKINKVNLTVTCIFSLLSGMEPGTNLCPETAIPVFEKKTIFRYSVTWPPGWANDSCSCFFALSLFSFTWCSTRRRDCDGLLCLHLVVVSDVVLHVYVIVRGPVSLGPGGRSGSGSSLFWNRSRTLTTTKKIESVLNYFIVVTV